MDERHSDERQTKWEWAFRNGLFAKRRWSEVNELNRGGKQNTDALYAHGVQNKTLWYQFEKTTSKK